MSTLYDRAFPDLTLLGESGDFMPPSERSEAPEWEHTRLLRTPRASVVRIDELRSPSRVQSLLQTERIFDPLQVLRLRRRLRDRPVMLAQSEQSGYVAALSMLGMRSDGRLFMIVHGHRWWWRRNRMLMRMAGRDPRVHFLCLSEAITRLLVEELDVDPSRVHTTGFGIDTDFFQPRPLRDDDPLTIVSAGAASRDYRTLALASRGLPAVVEIAADSTWYREELNVSEAETPENVRIGSQGNYVALRDLYARASFVVVPLHDVRHASGYAVIAEAMAMGKAVIATRTSAPSDLIVDGVTGFYVPPGDVGALRETMLRLIEAPNRAASMGGAARHEIEGRNSLSAYVGRLTAAMEAELSRH